MNIVFDVSDTVLQQMVQAIVKECDPEQVILFGSRASQTNRPDSDVDLLVITRHAFISGRNRVKEIARLERALKGIKIPTDILVFSREEMEKWRDSLNHVAGRALREGKVLYERSENRPG